MPRLGQPGMQARRPTHRKAHNAPATECHLVRGPVARRRRGGRRQERLARRDGPRLGGAGHPGAAGLRHHGRRLPPLPRGERARRADRRDDGAARRRQDDAGRGRAHRPVAAIVAGDWPEEIAAAILRELSRARPAPRHGRPRRRRALQRHRRGPAGRQLRRPAGDVPQHPRRGRRCSTPAGAATPRSSPTGRSPTAGSRASSTSKVALSVGVQQMVRSDIGGAGVMFSIDTESGFDRVVLINAAWGLGENVVQGAVDPDEYQVFKPLLVRRAGADHREDARREGAQDDLRDAAARRPTRNVPTSKDERARFVLTDDEILQLARDACTIERHYGQPMDMEWARDGETGEIYIVQARPETVQSRAARGRFRSYSVGKRGRKLLTGLSIGEAVVAGQVCLIETRGRHRPLRRRLDPRHLDDRPGLGADDEAGGGDRHRSWRAHLARRHRQPRAGPAGHRRHRQRHACAARRAGDHGLLRRGRGGLRLRGHRPSSRSRRSTRRRAGRPGRRSC